MPAEDERADECAALIAQARRAAARAYAPYSHFRVGAAALLVDAAGARHTIVGCNVENASFGLTLCAERSALAAAVAQFQLGGAAGARVARLALSCIDAPAVDGASDNAAIGDRAPCGACRQWIAELAPDAIISLDLGPGAPPADFSLDDLLPFSFRLRAE